MLMHRVAALLMARMGEDHIIFNNEDNAALDKMGAESFIIYDDKEGVHIKMVNDEEMKLMVERYSCRVIN